MEMSQEVIILDDVFLDVLSLYSCYLGQVSIKMGFDVSGTSELNKVYYNNNNNNDKNNNKYHYT